MLQQARQKIRESSGETAKTPLLNQGIGAKLPQRPNIQNQPSVETSNEDEADEDEEFFYEDEEIEPKNGENTGQGEINTTTRPKDVTKPVILTSNFFLPGKPAPVFEQQEHDLENQEPNDLNSDIGEANADEKDNAEDVIDALQEEETERFLEQTTKKLEVHTTALPSTSKAKFQVAQTTLDPNVEYEYYEYEDDETTTEGRYSPKPVVEMNENTTTNIDERDEAQTTGETDDPSTTAKIEVKSVKSSVSSGTSQEQIEASVEPVETSSVSTTETTENTVDSTEGYVVVASVQTSRSISGARYLTFPQVEQEEKKQSLSESSKDTKNGNDDDYNHENGTDDSNKADDLVVTHEHKSSTAAENKAEENAKNDKEEEEAEVNDKDKEEEVEEEEENATEDSEENVPRPRNESETTRSDVPKIKVHKLSSVSEKLAHLHELNEPRPEFTTKSVPVVIRKFSPRTTTLKPPAMRKTIATSKKPHFDDDDDEDSHLASLLPPGFKYRPNSFTETTITTSSTTTPTPETTTTQRTASKDDLKIGHELEDAAIQIGDKRIHFKEISLESLLPKNYKPSSESNASSDNKPSGESKSKAMNFTKINAESDLFTKIKFDDNLDAFLPKDYKLTTTPAPITKPPFHLSTVTEDISKFLPPGFKLPKESIVTTKRPMLKTTIDDISKFLPPGFKLPKLTTTTTEMPETKAPSDTSSLENVLNKLSFNTDIGSLLPPGYKSNASANDSATKEKADTNEKPATMGGSNASFKVVFPKGIGKRPGVRMTTPKPVLAEGPTPPGITIRKGLPTRYIFHQSYSKFFFGLIIMTNRISFE